MPVKVPPNQVAETNHVRLLYLGSASIEDPLIVSQVLRYLELLAPEYGCCHLVTLERRGWDNEEIRQRQEQLRRHRIQWHPVNQTGNHRLARFIRAWRGGIRTAKALIARHRINVIHARSFLAGRIALAVRTPATRMVYDMRGFWTLEKVDKGTIRSDVLRSACQSWEDQLFRSADHLVSLTRTGLDVLRRDGITTPASIIPCCVDLDRFPHALRSNAGRLRQLAVVGTLGEGYSAMSMFQFCKLLDMRHPGLEIRVRSLTDPDRIRAAARAAGFPLSQLDIGSCPSERLPVELEQADAGLCFVTPSLAKRASCPTKLAEYLAVGLPVVATVPVGDVEDLLKNERVGVGLHLDRPGEMRRAIMELEHLSTDPAIGWRCRSVAERMFSLQRGAAAYQTLHRGLAESIMADPSPARAEVASA